MKDPNRPGIITSELFENTLLSFQNTFNNPSYVVTGLGDSCTLLPTLHFQLLILLLRLDLTSNFYILIFVNCMVACVPENSSDLLI